MRAFAVQSSTWTCVLPLQAYVLNPAIYSAHLKLHPLMVLITLVVAEHNMGVWGLLLAVPLTVFALDYLIRYPQSTVTEVGAKELEKVRWCYSLQRGRCIRTVRSRRTSQMYNLDVSKHLCIFGADSTRGSPQSSELKFRVCCPPPSFPVCR